MRLSDAIRLGAMMKPQHRGGILSSDGTKTCALGAALDALGKLDEWLTRRASNAVDWAEWFGNALPPDSYRSVKWPPAAHKMIYGDTQYPLATVVTVLNDVNGWTREQIADWVEQVEKEYDKEKQHIETEEVVGAGSY